MPVEASSRKYLDALAQKISELYDIFDSRYNPPTMGDVLKAKDGKESVTWDYRKKRGQKFTSTPLQDLFTQEVWSDLEDLNDFTNRKIHDGLLPSSSEGKPYFILPRSKFDDDLAERFKAAAMTVNLVFEKDDLTVKDGGKLSGSSGSDSSSPDKDKAH